MTVNGRIEVEVNIKSKCTFLKHVVGLVNECFFVNNYSIPLFFFIIYKCPVNVNQ